MCQLKGLEPRVGFQSETKPIGSAGWGFKSLPNQLCTPQSWKSHIIPEPKDPKQETLKLKLLTVNPEP